MSNHKFELTWVVKENLPKLAPRIFPVGSAKLCHAKNRVTGNNLLDEAEA